MAETEQQDLGFDLRDHADHDAVTTAPSALVVTGNVSSKTPPTPSVVEREFNWSTADCVILNEQPCTAVYTNPQGGIVIRQERDWNEEEDPYVYFADASAIHKLIDALNRELVANGYQPHPAIARGSKR